MNESRNQKQNGSKENEPNFQYPRTQTLQSYEYSTATPSVDQRLETLERKGSINSPTSYEFSEATKDYPQSQYQLPSPTTYAQLPTPDYRGANAPHVSNQYNDPIAPNANFQYNRPMSVATDGVGYSPVSADPRHSASLDLNYPTQEDIPTQHQYSPNTVADLNNARYPPPAQYDNSLASQEPTHNQQPVVNKYDVFYTTPGGLTPSSSQPSPYTVRPSFDPLMNSKEDYDDYKAPRARICCCFKSICSCCCCFLFIILLLAILLYLAFPGLPTATVSDLYIPTNSAGLQTSQSEDGTIKISMDYATDVSLYSPSFFSITMEKFTVQVDLKSQTGSIIPGFGGKGVVNNINFKSKTNTTFTIPLTVTYSTSKDEFANNNPVQILLTDSCLATPQKGLETRITMTAVLSLISWIGYNPSFGFTKSVPCPDKDRLESILKNIS